jgi:hypothetical protein
MLDIGKHGSCIEESLLSLLDPGLFVMSFKVGSLPTVVWIKFPGFCFLTISKA